MINFIYELPFEVQLLLALLVPFIGSMPNDIGRNRIRAIVELSPGTAPKMIPTTTPIRISSRQTGSSNTI